MMPMGMSFWGSRASRAAGNGIESDISEEDGAGAHHDSAQSELTESAGVHRQVRGVICAMENDHPTPMKTITTASLTTTIRALARADSWIPTISSTEIRNTMITAGILTIPSTKVPSGSFRGSNGLAHNRAGRSIPKLWTSETT